MVRRHETMITDKMTYRWLWSCLIAGGLLLSSCSDDSLETVEQPSTPELGNTLQLQAVTRTSGATQIGNADCPDIKAYLATATELMQIGNKYYGTFHYNTSSTPAGWTSDISVKEERQYYLYGYMPASLAATVDMPSGGYSDGIDLKFANLPAISEDDICVVVGVQRLDGPLAGSATANVDEGNFSYLSGIVNKNYVNLLMGHIYAGMELNFMIDADYAKIRSIHLKSVTLSTNYGTVNATIKLRNKKGIDEATFDKVEDGSGTTKNILETTDPKVVLDNTATLTGKTLDMIYCFPSIFAQADANLNITSIYDVYDRNADLADPNTKPIRANCSSTNKLKIAAAALVPGQKKTVVLTVKPTYLYVLSDGDLDNPVVTIN